MYVYIYVYIYIYIYKYIYMGAASPDFSSQLTFSEQWFGPQAFTHEVVGSTPGSRVRLVTRTLVKM